MARQRRLAASIGFAIALVAAMTGAWSTAAQGPDPNLGTWELNVAKSRFSPGPPPRSETRTYAQDGAVIRATSKGVDASGNPTSSQWTNAYDGTEQKIGEARGSTIQHARMDHYSANPLRNPSRPVRYALTFQGL